jgi:thioredoxin reductase (NADPH)
MTDSYDVLILGGGPAGLTAGIYCGRYNLKTLVIAGDVGGTAKLAGEVENWPGFVGRGVDIMTAIEKQARRFDVEFLQVMVDSVEKTGNDFILKHENGSVSGKSLIVCLGTEHRILGIPGEKEFLGKGVSYCATCDGNFFRDKNVAVVGGANSAAKTALYLSDICNKVIIVYRGHEMRCETVSLDRIKEADNIEIVYDAKPVEVIGDSVVKKLVIGVDGEKRVLDVDGVFVEIGSAPASEILKRLGLDMDEGGYVKVGRDMKTSVEGVFAAGDVTDGVMKQMITAAGDGAVAAKGVYEFLKGT